jgi:alpha-glucosidase (family GH31 glycosyl hydrolase)
VALFQVIKNCFFLFENVELATPHDYFVFKISDVNQQQNFTVDPKNFDQWKQRHQVVAWKIFLAKILIVKSYFGS